MSPPHLPNGALSTCLPTGFLPAFAHSSVAVPQAHTHDGSAMHQQGASRQAAHGMPGTSPHQQHSRLAHVYSNAPAMLHQGNGGSPGGHGLANLLQQSMHIGTPPSASRAFPQQLPHDASTLSAQAQAHGARLTHARPQQQPPPMHFWPSSLSSQQAAQQQQRSAQPAPASLHPTTSEPVGSHLPSVRPHRSASERLSPHSSVADSSSVQTPRGAPPLATGVPRPRVATGTQSGGSTPRGGGGSSTAQSGHGGGPQLGRHPASGFAGVPLTPAQTLKRYAGAGVLTEYEQSEVLNYPQVYYIGSGAHKHRARPKRRALLVAIFLCLLC